MNVVVCDASPLIILAKLDRLHLIQEVLGGDIIVLKCVADEVLGERAGATERTRLFNFLNESATICHFSGTQIQSKSLSESDCSTLTYCIQNEVDWLVADERLMRRVASEHGLAIIGVLGIVVGAARRRIIALEEAQSILRDAVARHDLRISVALYQRVLDELRELS